LSGSGGVQPDPAVFGCSWWVVVEFLSLEPCGCRKLCHPYAGLGVFVDQAAEPVASEDARARYRSGRRRPPAGRVHAPIEVTSMRIRRRDRLGGPIREYVQVA
jgi:hypothetical protein